MGGGGRGGEGGQESSDRTRLSVRLLREGEVEGWGKGVGICTGIGLLMVSIFICRYDWKRSNKKEY